MTFARVIEVLTDNFISLSMTVAVIYMLLMQYDIPEWFVGLYGTIIAFYFKTPDYQTIPQVQGGK